ncbi:hypothetical protein [Planktothrix rubescens]|jgi:hypothetical protein|uniref:hypothetical protein n=1 Tax=Planktothrix rubescens TaxID=59512 RepID=UPI0003F4B8D2|nr:hypothetical protein [Planktothrix rubescens]
MPEDYWEMYDDAGNIAVSKMMQELKQALSNQSLPQVREQLHQKIKELSKRHGEVYDTEVRCMISSRLTCWASEIHNLKSPFRFNSDYWNL